MFKKKDKLVKDERTPEQVEADKIIARGERIKQLGEEAGMWRPQSAEVRAERSARLKGKKQDPAVVARRAISLRAAWARRKAAMQEAASEAR